MGILNPNLLSKHTSLILNESAKIMTTVGKRVLMPEIVLTLYEVTVRPAATGIEVVQSCTMVGSVPASRRSARFGIV